MISGRHLDQAQVGVVRSVRAPAEAERATYMAGGVPQIAVAIVKNT